MVEKPEEKKPEDVKPEEQKPDKYQETPEDVEKARALIQQQSQEKSEKLKEAELTAEQMRFERDSALARLDQTAVAERSQPPVTDGRKKAETATEKQRDDADDATTDEVADDYLTKADLKKVISTVRNEVRSVLTEREEEAQIQKMQDTVQSQQDVAMNEISKFANRLDIPKNVYNEMVKAANEVVPLWNNVNGPHRVARYMMERMENWRLQNSRQAKVEQDQKNDAAMVEHNKNALQPAGSGISPPSQSDFEKQQQEAADEIAPDDVPVTTS